MTAALNSTGRQIFFNLCEWGVNRPWEWARPVRTLTETKMRHSKPPMLLVVLTT